MASKGVILNRLSQPLGSKYLNADDHTEVNCTGFVAQEDTTITLLEGGDSSADIETNINDYYNVY